MKSPLLNLKFNGKPVLAITGDTIITAGTGTYNLSQLGAPKVENRKEGYESTNVAN